LHSELVRSGLLDYIRALPQGELLFPGLKRLAAVVEAIRYDD